MAESPFELDLSQLPPELLMQLMTERQQLVPPPNGPSGMLDAGLGPVTPNSMAGMPNPTAMPTTPTGPQNAGLATRESLTSMGMPGLGERLSPFVENTLEYGAMPAKGYVDQLKRADSAIGDLARDPSIANAANVGVQGSAALMAPRAMLGSAAVGVGDALMKDLGVSPFTSDAQANGKGGSDPQAKLDAVMKKLQRGGFNNATRRALEGEAKMYRDLIQQGASSQIGLDADKKRGEQEEYDRRVQGAEVARDKARDKDWSFDDTYFGDFYRKMGGAAPFVAAAGTGAVGRLAHGPAKSMLGKIAPYPEGVAGAATAAYLPDLTNAYMTPAENMRKRSLEEYGNELPEGHPRKQSSLDAAARMPNVSPARSAAQEVLENPSTHKGRAAMALLEGSMGPVGAGLVNRMGGAPRAALDAVRGQPGASAGQGATPLATGPAGPSAALPAPQTVAKPVTTQKPGEITVNIAAAQAAAKAHREAMAKYRADPDMPAFFEQTKDLGPKKLREAFEAQYGPMRQKSILKLREQVSADSAAKGLADAKAQLADTFRSAQGADRAAWDKIAAGGNEAKREILAIMPHVKQGFPALANMSDEQVIRIIRGATKSAP